MPKIPDRASDSLHPNEGHAVWCDLEQHQLLADDGFPGCVSSVFWAGRVGGWLVEHAQQTKVVLDWKPQDEQELTLSEAADLLGYLAQALAKAAGR